MTHSKTTRRVALLATTALVGTAFAAAPVAAQGDPNVCDGVIEGPVELQMTVHSGTNPGPEPETVEAFNTGVGAELGVSIVMNELGEGAYATAIKSAAAAGEMPDIVDMDGPYLYEFVWADLLAHSTAVSPRGEGSVPRLDRSSRAPSRTSSTRSAHSSPTRTVGPQVDARGRGRPESRGHR